MLTRMDGAQNGSIWLLSADDSMAVQNMWYYQYELYPAVTAVEAQSSETDVDLGYNIGEHDVTWLVLFGVTDDFTARYADLADDGLRSAQSTAPALYAVTNVDGRIYGGCCPAGQGHRQRTDCRLQAGIAGRTIQNTAPCHR